jgi:hypothetical protein
MQEFAAGRLGLLRELLPQATRFGLLVQATGNVQSIIGEARTAAAAIGQTLELFSANTNREIEAAFAAVVQKRIENVRCAVVGGDLGISKYWLDNHGKEYGFGKQRVRVF